MSGNKKFQVAIALSSMMLVLGATGCEKPSNILDKVIFTPSEDLQSITLGLSFKDNVKSSMSGSIDTPYGVFFMNPYTETTKFELGFALNMNIFYDQNYIGLTPVMTLPNGLPIGIPYPVVEVKKPTPIHEKFDMYGYVDIGHLSWLGVSTMFYFMNDAYFPADLAVSSVFLRDDLGRPGVIASVFGPSIAPDGTLLRNGGLAVFANVRQLIEQAIHDNNRGPMTLLPERGQQIYGPAAPQYSSPRALQKLEKKIIKGLNGA